MSRPVEHGIRALEEQWRRGDLTPATVEILREYISAVAGDGALTVREGWVLEGAAFARFIVLRMFNEVVKRGDVFVTNAAGERELHPLLAKSAATWINTIRLNLLAVGLRPDRSHDEPRVCARCHQTFPASAQYLQHDCRPANENGARPDALPSANDLHVDGANDLHVDGSNRPGRAPQRAPGEHEPPA